MGIDSVDYGSCEGDGMETCDIWWLGRGKGRGVLGEGVLGGGPKRVKWCD